jgi:hypothetical protein
MPTTTKVLTSEKKTTTTRKKTSAPEKIVELPPNPFIFEILDVVSSQRSNAKKVEVLQKYSHPSLKAIFIWNFDESVHSLLPEGDVPYSNLKDDLNTTGSFTDKMRQEVETMKYNSTDSIGTIDNSNAGHTSIRKEYEMFYNFIRGGNNSLTSIRREMMFINMLQGLHPKEAEIVCLVKDKRLDQKYKITKDIVSEAYPDIQWGGRS